MKINKKYKIRKIAGESVLIMQGEYGVDLTKIISFNETSEWLWNELTDRDFTMKDVKEMILSKYHVDEPKAQKDSQEWIDKLLKYHLIEE